MMQVASRYLPARTGITIVLSQRRWLRDYVAGAAMMVFILDGLFVGWKTFVWLDLVALLALGWASTASRRRFDRFPDDFEGPS
jgi:hypothetical protein